MAIEKKGLTEEQEYVHNKNRDDLSKMNITINNFERFEDKLESYTGEFDGNIKDIDFRITDIFKVLETGEKNISKYDWEGTNQFKNMYNEAKRIMKELMIQNDYRRQWVNFLRDGGKKFVDLLRAIRMEYDEIALAKAEKVLAEGKITDMKKEIMQGLSEIRVNVNKLSQNGLKVDTSIPHPAPDTQSTLPEVAKPNEFAIDKKKFCSLVKVLPVKYDDLAQVLGVPRNELNKNREKITALKMELIKEGELPEGYRIVMEKEKVVQSSS